MSIKFTILIASKNEERDIRLALDSSVEQRYLNKEIIVVDDSDDNTKSIVREYEGFGVKLINGKGEGCCRARNLGIEMSSGDVIVFLTADTKLYPDYLDKLAPYYEAGYDWVLTQSFSYNLENVYSRCIEMQHRYIEKKKGFDPLTSAGYSVRKSAAVAVGMISGGVYPFNTCRDWSLGKKLSENGYKKIYDRKLIVPHKSDDNLKDYWTVRKTRGLMSAYQPLFMFRRPPLLILIKFIMKLMFTTAKLGLVIPAVCQVITFARYSNRPVFDSLLLIWPYYIQEIAMCYGEFQGFFRSLPHLRSGSINSH